MVESADSKPDAGSTRTGAVAAMSPIIDALLETEDLASALVDQTGVPIRTNDSWDEAPCDVPADLLEGAISSGTRAVREDLEVLPLGDGSHALVRRKRRREPERKFSHSTILNAAGEGIYGLDREGRTVFANRAASDLVGWEIDDLSGKRQHHILHHSHADGQPYDESECPIRDTLEDGRPRKVAGEVFWRKDGSAFPVEYTTTPVMENGDVVGAVVVFRDVTEVKRTLDRRGRSEAHLRAIINALPDTVVRISRDGIIRDIRMAEGFNPEVPQDMEDVEMDIRDFLGPELVGRFQAAIRSAYATGQIQTFEYDWEVAGEPRTREVRIVVIGEEEVLAVIRDITSERAAQRNLKASEQRFRAIFNSMFQMIGLMNVDGTLIEANETALRFGGVDASDVIGRKIWETRWWDVSEEARERARDAVRRAAAGEFVRYEEDVLGSDGNPAIIDFSIKPVHDDRGDVVLLIPEGRDIEEIKAAKDQLAASEARLAGIVDSSLDSVMAFQSVRDENGHIVDFEWIYVNTRAADMVGRDVESLIGRRLLVEMPGNREEGLFDDYVRVVEEGNPNVREFYYEHEDVEAYLVNTSVKLGDGFMVAFRDVTPERLREEELRSSQRLLAHAQTLAKMGSWQWDPQSGELSWSDELYRIYGLDPGDAVSFESYIEAVVPDDRERIAAVVSRVLETREPFSYEERIRRPDGSIRLLSSTGEVLEDNEGYVSVVGVCQDITESREAEERLLRSERRLQYAQRIAHLGSWDWDLATDQVTVSHEMARILGLETESLSFERFIECVHEEDRARVERELRRAIDEKAEFKFYYTIVRAGEERILRAEGELVCDARGEAQRVFSTGHDVTEIRRAEEQIRESEQRFRQLADQISDLVGVHDPDGRYAYVSPSSTRILGYEPHEMIGRTPLEFVHPDDASRLENLTVSTREVDHPGEAIVRMKHRDGSWLWLEMVTTTITNEHGDVTSIQTSARDVTARVEAQQVAARSSAVLAQRNRELQDFAYVASHDLQEPLRKIRAFADLVIDEAGEKLDEDNRFYLTRIQESAARMTTLISDLLAFSRIATRGKPFADVSLQDIVEEVVSDLEYLIRDSEGTIAYDELPTFRADRTQIRQLMQNLIGNGLKFKREDVRSHISIRGGILRDALHPGMDIEPLVEIIVEDNGIGFEEKYLDRIFTPFQRLHSRAEYAGTGMGLAICRRIVERHGGFITAGSSPGAGSRFVVRLPINRYPDQ